MKLKIIVLNTSERSIHTFSFYLEEFFKENKISSNFLHFQFSPFSPRTIQTYLVFSYRGKRGKKQDINVDVKEERAKFLFGPASMYMRAEKETITYLHVKLLHVFERTGHRHQVYSQ